jgi:hypothetical protein
LFSYVPTSHEPRLAICIKTDNNKIQYQGDVREEFGNGPQKKLIFNYFAQAVLRKTAQKTVFKSAEFNCESVVLHWDTLVLQGLALQHFQNIAVPRGNDPIEFLKSSPDFVLWISDIGVNKEFSSGTAPELSVNSHFVLWDVGTRKVVSYGYIQVSDRSWAITMENWDRIMEMYVDKLFSKTPFFVSVH